MKANWIARFVLWPSELCQNNKVNGDNQVLGNVGVLPHQYVLSQHRRQPAEFSLTSKYQVSETSQFHSYKVYVIFQCIVQFW